MLYVSISGRLKDCLKNYKVLQLWRTHQQEIRVSHYNKKGKRLFTNQIFSRIIILAYCVVDSDVALDVSNFIRESSTIKNAVLVDITANGVRLFAFGAYLISCENVDNSAFSDRKISKIVVLPDSVNRSRCWEVEIEFLEKVGMARLSE
jgi:uncharacterized protein (UPF0303 family)